MSEEQNIEPDVKQEADTQVENNVPISRLNEVISERNELRQNLESFKTKEEEEERSEANEGRSLGNLVRNAAAKCELPLGHRREGQLACERVSAAAE